jgi:hypothetical protein
LLQKRLRADKCNQGFSVDCVSDRLADPDVVEGFLGRVQVQVTQFPQTKDIDYGILFFAWVWIHRASRLP